MSSNRKSNRRSSNNIVLTCRLPMSRTERALKKEITRSVRSSVTRTVSPARIDTPLPPSPSPESMLLPSAERCVQPPLLLAYQEEVPVL